MAAVSYSPRMTWPTPILTSKSPRPTEESNLCSKARLAECRAGVRREKLVLGTLAVGLGRVLEPTSVLDDNSVAGGGRDAGAFLESSLVDAHLENVSVSGIEGLDESVIVRAELAKTNGGHGRV